MACIPVRHTLVNMIGCHGQVRTGLAVPELSDQSVDEANEIVSDLAHWIGSSDPGAVLRIAEGFGAALSMAASMRAGGSNADAIALALAEKAHVLGEMRDARHVGWLLLSVKLELLHLASTHPPTSTEREAAGLLREIEQLITELLRKSAAALR